MIVGVQRLMSNKRIAICVNHFYPLIGGCEVVTKRIADFLHNHNYKVFVLTRRVKKRKSDDIPYKVCEYTAGDLRSFQNNIRSINPDYILVYSDVFDFFQQLITSDLQSKLIVALCGANWIHRNRSFANVFVRNSHKLSKIITHSKLDRDYKFCNIEKLKDKLMVIPNGVDLDEFDNNRLTKRDLIPDLADKKWILNVSNFFPGKGQEHAFDILKNINDDFAYIQVCSSIDFNIGQQLEFTWEKLSKVKYSKIISRKLKDISRDKIVGLFKNSNAFIFTSEKEVAPLVILECMASRLPWVSTDVGNVRELKGGKVVPAIKNNQGYSVFDSRVKSFMAKEIESIIHQPSIAFEGRNQIEDEMNWTKVLPQYLSVIENA